VTTSGTISSTLIASEVILAAMTDLGVLSAGENPTGEETELGLRTLNFMLKSWQGRGVTSWRDTEGSVAFASGTAKMVLTPYCLDVTEARLIQASNYERPLQRWELAQYRQIPNKATPGYPTAYTVSKLDASISLTLWPVPNATMTILYSYPRIIEDVTDGAQTIDVPQEWLETVYYGLASRLVAAFGVSRIDPAAAQRVDQRAASLEQILLGSDMPASVYMGSSMGRLF